MKNIILILLGLYSQNLYSQNLLGGSLTTEYLGNTSYLFKFVTYSVDYSTSDSLSINFSDGIIKNVGLTYQNDMDGYIENIYEIEHTFPSNGNYVVSTRDSFLVPNVININNSEQRSIFIHCDIKISSFFPDGNNSPIRSDTFNFYTDSSGKILYQPIITDIENDYFNVYLTEFPSGTAVLPNANQIFIDNQTHLFTWDRPIIEGFYGLSFYVEEWRGGAILSKTYHSIIFEVDSLMVTNIISFNQPKFTLNLHPNPTSESLQITTDSPVDEIQIYNSIGQQVWQGQGFRESQVRVNVRDFSDGMYIVRVRQGDFWVSEQVLVR